MAGNPVSHCVHRPQGVPYIGWKAANITKNEENKMKKVIVVVSALALCAFVESSKADTSWIAYSNVVGTVTLNATSGVVVAPIPNGWVCVKKTIRVSTGTAFGLSGKAGSAATNSYVLIQAADGLVTLSEAPLIDAAPEYGVSTGGTTKVDYILKLTK